MDYLVLKVRKKNYSSIKIILSCLFIKEQTKLFNPPLKITHRKQNVQMVMCSSPDHSLIMLQIILFRS